MDALFYVLTGLPIFLALATAFQLMLNAPARSGWLWSAFAIASINIAALLLDLAADYQPWAGAISVPYWPVLYAPRLSFTSARSSFGTRTSISPTSGLSFFRSF